MIIPIKYKRQGLRLYCNKCKREVSSKCGETGEKPAKCNSQKYWKYKMIFHIPQVSGPGKKKTKICSANTINEALIELYQKKGEFKEDKKPFVSNGKTLLNGIQSYLRKKHNEGEYQGQSKQLSNNHKEDVVRTLERFIESLRLSGNNPDEMFLDDLDASVLNSFYTFIRTFGTSTSMIDRHTRIMRNFLKFLTDRGMYKGANFFKTVDLSPIVSSPISITDDELQTIVKIITIENGIAETTKGKRIDFFRPWMAFVFQLARHTGLRTEEIYELKWDDTITVGEHKLLMVHNLKVERLKSQENILKVVPVTQELEKLLLEIKNSNYSGVRVIETGYNGEYFGDLIGRAFTHFYKIAFPNKKHKLFKQLRKTQMSDIYALLGEDAHKLSDHSGNVILEKHYVDKVQAAIKLLDIKLK